MKTQLELKHLDFANNGKVRLTRLPHWDFENVDLQHCELHFNHACNEPFLKFKGVTFGLNQIKVYKRPLSDLTKEIEHNGERFVPVEILSELIDQQNMGYNDHYIDYSDDITTRCSWLNEPYFIVEKLFEWKFNVFMLPEHLYVDVNTLEINPYK